MLRTTDAKVQTVLTRNTFWFQDTAFEETYEKHITSLRNTLLVLRHRVKSERLTKPLIEALLSEKANGLKVLLALTGFSNENFKRLVTFIRIVDDPELSRVSHRDQWLTEEPSDDSSIKEWSNSKIEKKIQQCADFRKGIVNIFFEGATIPILANMLPLFELKKLSISKLNFETEAMIDTLVR